MNVNVHLVSSLLHNVEILNALFLDGRNKRMSKFFLWKSFVFRPITVLFTWSRSPPRILRLFSICLFTLNIRLPNVSGLCVFLTNTWFCIAYNCSIQFSKFFRRLSYAVIRCPAPFGRKALMSSDVWARKGHQERWSEEYRRSAIECQASVRVQYIWHWCADKSRTI